MTATIIITLSILILIAYAFDLSSKHTRVPTVILLLVLGWGMRQLAVFFKVGLPELQPLLPILGTVGLILIVLEGGLDLELNHSKRKVLNRSAISALLPLIVLQLGVGYAFSYFSGTSLINGMVNALPLCIISSAIAIPSVRYLSDKDREFVIYESSFSDIFGVILFNFFIENETVTLGAVGHFILQAIIMLLISMAASMLLA